MLCLGAPRLEAEDLQELDCAAWAQRFKVTSKLGQGGFADVLCVKDVTKQQPAALKVLKTSTIPGLAELTGAAAASLNAGHAPEVSLFREARALKHARHPNVVQLRSVVHIPRACVADSSVSRGKRDKMGSCWGLLLELLPGGSLQKRVYDLMAHPHSAGYSNIDALAWGVDIATAVAHLHSLNPVIIHRDLKLQNFLLKPLAGADAAGRKLPMATLTDFGLHVMIDRPPSPFFLATGDDGMPMLILQPDFQQPEQQLDSTKHPPSAADLQKQPVAGRASGDGTAAAAAAAATADCAAAAAAAAGDCFIETWRVSNSSSSDADAHAKVAPTGIRIASSGGCGGDAHVPCVSALKGTQHQRRNGSKPNQHVAFAVDISAAPAPAAPDDVDADDHTAADTNGLLGCNGAQIKDKQQRQQQLFQPSQQQQQQDQQRLQRLSRASAPQQWTRLTAGTLRRLSMDNSSSCRAHSAGVQLATHDRLHSSSGSTHKRSGSDIYPHQVLAIPLMVQPSGVSADGSFVFAAVPSGVFASEGAGQQQDEGTAAGLAVVGSAGHSRPGSHGGSSSAGRESAGSIGDGSINSILAAANLQRDYEVNLKSATLEAQRLQRLSPGPRSSGRGSNVARSCTSDTATSAAGTAAASAAAVQAGEGCSTPRGAASVSGMSVRSADWPTAASMMWDDLMEGNIDQELLLDDAVPAMGSGHGGLIELPLSYNLTGHTGSFMYMAPEVFKGKPYNESVDVFSIGVILYELFSRTLLIFTHTPANSPADCEHYAARIASGFRPRHVKSIPLGVWELIQACWEQDPGNRPSAAEVLQKLQVLLQEAHAAAAANAAAGPIARLGRILHLSSHAAGAAPVPAPGCKAGQSVGGDAAAPANGKADSRGVVGVGGGSTGQEAAMQRDPEASCGCVIC